MTLSHLLPSPTSSHKYSIFLLYKKNKYSMGFQDTNQKIPPENRKGHFRKFCSYETSNYWCKQKQNKKCAIRRRLSIFELINRRMKKCRVIKTYRKNFWVAVTVFCGAFSLCLFEFVVVAGGILFVARSIGYEFYEKCEEIGLSCLFDARREPITSLTGVLFHRLQHKKIKELLHQPYITI